MLVSVSNPSESNKRRKFQSEPGGIRAHIYLVRELRYFSDQPGNRKPMSTLIPPRRKVFAVGLQLTVKHLAPGERSEHTHAGSSGRQRSSPGAAFSLETTRRKKEFSRCLFSAFFPRVLETFDKALLHARSNAVRCLRRPLERATTLVQLCTSTARPFYAAAPTGKKKKKKLPQMQPLLSL